MRERDDDYHCCGCTPRRGDCQPCAVGHRTMHRHHCITWPRQHASSGHTVLMTTLQRTIKPMCQEGIHLVTRPLPVYPHTKTVVTDQEGEEVGRLINGFQAVLLQGHGATTTGANLEEAVMHMLHLEE